MTAPAWITWEGGDCPVGEDVRVDIVLDNGCVMMHQRAGAKYWEAGKNTGQQIVAYRLWTPEAPKIRHAAVFEWNFNMEQAPKRGRLLAIVDHEVRLVAYGKTSHVPIYGFCLVDQGAEDSDLCEPTAWMPLPSVDRRDTAEGDAA